MKRHFFKQSLLRTMMIVATLLFMMPAQKAWADNVATATVDGNTYTYSSLEAAVSAANGAQSTATVTLLKDITEQPCSLEVRKPMIIDLNNHRINTTTNYSLFYIYLSNGQQMTIKNGSIRGRQNDVYIYKGEAVLENITAEAPSSGSDCVYICNTCSLTISKSITFDASIYNQGYVKIASGQKLYDKNGIEYSGYINSRVDDLANNTLSSLVTVTANGITDTYNSLESAVSAATYAYTTYGTAATVKLNHDITQQTCSLEVKKPMIIDLNNHRINSTANFSLFYIYLSNGQQMTIKNGSIRGTEYDVYIYKGEAVLENITAEAPSSGSNCVRVCNTCSLTVSKRITFDASIDNSGIVKIASGQTLYDKNGIEYSGYINSRVANLANNTLSSLVTVTANGTTTSYNSLQDAVSAANSAESAATITLNHDITAQTCSLEVRKPMIIDLNGHVVNADNLTYAYGIFSIMNAEGQVIIKNGTISRKGANSYNGFAIYNFNSNLELENVTVKNTYSAANPCLYNSGTLTISKGITFVGSIDNSGTVQIAEGQLLCDASENHYRGVLTSAQVSALTNTTLSFFAVPYIDAAGNTAHCADYKLLSTSNEAITLTTGWYVVDGEVTLSGIISLSGDVNFILCDGARLNVPFLTQGTNSMMDYILYNPEGNIAIYGQEAGTGVLYSERIIYNGAGGITFNGGNVTIIDKNFGYCITNAGEDIVVNGGTLNVRCGVVQQGKEGLNVGIYQTYCAVVINGGIVNIDANWGIAIIDNSESREYTLDDDDEEAASRAHTKRAASYNFNPKLVMNGGRLTINSASYGIGSIGGIDFNGGQLTALASGVNSYGIYMFSDATLNLSYTNTSDFFYISNMGHDEEFSPQIIVADGKTFYDGLGHSYSGNITDSADDLAGKILRPFDYLLLADNNDNADVIANHAGSTIPVALQGRTLWKDGDWNTIVLPFNLASLTDTPLEGATVKALTSTAFADGTLTLNFTEDDNNLSSIEAGKPYIIKWDKPANYVAYNGKNAASCSDLVNPVFTGVTISDATNNVTTDYVTFCGTYDPVTWTEEDKSILFLGAANTLYYPQNGASLGACRAYFQLTNPTTNVREFNLNFNEEETTSLSEELRIKSEERADAAWYTINGVKLDSKPSSKGIYIHGGRKVVIK